MPFTDRFQLLDLKRDDGARTFEAREVATGRPVLVHLFSDSASPLLAQIDLLPEQERQRLIDRGEYEGGVYIVTDRLAEYPDLREWLKDKSEDAPKSLGVAGAWRIAPSLTNSGERTLQMPAAPVAAQPGEFTRQFAPPVLRPAPSEPGEFTRLFAAAPPKSAPPLPKAAAPGEFTQMLQSQRPDTPAPPKESQPGEFTRFFQSPMTPSAQAIEQPIPQTVQQPGDAGEFTQVFGRGDHPPPPAASANATQAFETPRPMAPIPMEPSQEPGEYTRLFAQPAPLTLGQAPAGPQSPRFPESAPPPRNESRLPLLLVLGAAVLLIVAGIVYFVMRAHAA